MRAKPSYMRRPRLRLLAVLVAGVWGAALTSSPDALAEPARKTTSASRAAAQGKHQAQKAPKGATPKKASPKKPAPKPAKKPLESKKPAKAKSSPPKPADPQARTSIAGQPVVEPAEPAELKELRDVEEVLFWDQKPEATAAKAPEVVSSGLPPADQSAAVATDRAPAELDLRWMTQLQKPDLPFRWDDRLIRYLDYFKNNPRGKGFVSALLKKSGRYDGKIREALKGKGLPEDLVYLALAESAMNPRIVSHAGAAGLWQFMPKAGEAYGLRVDKHVDERLDPHRSTQAAVKFLKDLHSRFGRWELAMAAYNMGHGGLLTSIRKYNTNDFWELSRLEAGIPYETALYVPKIVALAFVARNREAFGLADLELDPAEPFDTSALPATPEAEQLASAAAGPASKPGAAASAKPAPPVLAPEPSIETTTYTLRWGESLEVVAASFGLTESKLRALNNLKDPVPPRPGSKVLVPKQKAKPAALDPLVAVVPAATHLPAPDKKQVFYEVVWGDKLDEVARVLGVTPDELAQWNNIDRSANLHGKMVLQAFVSGVPAASEVRVTRASDAKVLVAGSSEFFDHFESKNGRTRTVVTVASGDTMKSLAKKHGLSLGMMERINHRSRDAELAPGEQLVVYTRKSTPLAPPQPAPAAPAAPSSPVPGADDIYAIDDRPTDVDGG